MFKMHRRLVRGMGWTICGIVLASCVGTELVAHSDHPGSPKARSGNLPAAVGLVSDFDSGTDQSTAPGASHDHGTTSREAGGDGHAHAEHASPSSHQDGSAQHDSNRAHEDASPVGGANAGDASALRFTCPMHPEVDRGEPGACPKCGMKLVPKAKARK
jgi:hypothetical protein